MRLLDPGPVTLSGWVRYSTLAELVRVGLAKLGIEMAVPPEQSSVALHAYRLPGGLAYSELHDPLQSERFVIYTGRGVLSKTLLRLQTMGDLVAADIERLWKCSAQLLG